MSEEIKAAEAVEETIETKEEILEAAAENSESMADFEDKLDKDSFEAPVWNRFKEILEQKETITVKIDSVVKGGVITFIDGIRAFIPQSHIALGRVDDLNALIGKEISVRIIEVEQATKKLVLSAREVLKEEARKAKRAAAESVEKGTVMSGKVETLQPYGAFIRLENGLSGLVHVSQISVKRVKDPSDELNIGDEVQVKVIDIKDGKLSLSMKALAAPAEERHFERPERPERAERVEIPKAENISTNLGDLLKGIKL